MPRISTSASTDFKLSRVTAYRIRHGDKSITRYQTPIDRDAMQANPTQAHFSILKHLLQDGGGVIRVSCDPEASRLTAHVDRTKIISHGKPSLGRYLCRLHIWRCTADVAACKELYEPLCAVDGEYELWRQIVSSKPSPRWKFVQPNTMVNGNTVNIKVYEESNEGIIQSWAERAV